MKINEIEKKCSSHTKGVNVSVDDKLPSKYDLKIIAGVLRVIAENTDGYCANKHADNEDLNKAGMIFHFTTEEKRNNFKRDVGEYVPSGIKTHLKVTIMR